MENDSYCNEECWDIIPAPTNVERKGTFDGNNETNEYLLSDNMTNCVGNCDVIITFPTMNNAVKGSSANRYKGYKDVTKESKNDQSPKNINGDKDYTKENENDQSQKSKNGDKDSTKGNKNGQPQISINGDKDIKKGNKNDQSQISINGDKDITKENKNDQSQISINGDKDITKENKNDQSQISINGDKDITKEKKDGQPQKSKIGDKDITEKKKNETEFPKSENIDLLNDASIDDGEFIFENGYKKENDTRTIVNEDQIVPDNLPTYGSFDPGSFDIKENKKGLTESLKSLKRLKSKPKLIPINDVKKPRSSMRSKSFKGELDSLLDTPKKRRNTMGRLKKKMSTESIIDDMSHISSSVYSLHVYEPQHYTDKKREEKRKRKNIMRMLAGIPFAILYGVFLYLLLRFIILSDPREHITAMGNNTRNSSSYINDTSTQEHRKWRGKETVYFSGKHHSELIYASTGFTVLFGTISVFSRSTRCSMLLIFPCLITGRSRTILFTFILGLLIDGPIESLVHNFNEVTKNSACVYGALARMAHSSLLKLNQIFGMFTRLKEATKNPFGMMAVPGTTISPTTEPEKSNLTFPRISAIRDQIAMVKNGINEARNYIGILRKTLTILSIVLMVIDAIKYLRMYYSDNSFDNMYVNRNVRHFWKRKGYAKITPLRHWERKEGYKSSVGKCTVIEVRKTLRKIARSIIPTFLFSVVVCLVCVSDYILANVIQATKDKEDIKISISFKDIEKEFAATVQLIIEKFYERTDKCEIHPMITLTRKYILIMVFLLIAAISCGCEILFSRMRARMCNIFYNHRAQERADYLYYRLKAGRINRRIELRLLIRRELERRERLEEFSPWRKLTRCLFCCKNKDSFVCPGCGWKEKKENKREARYELGNTKINADICRDCYADFHIICNHTGSNHVRESYFVVNENE